MKEKPRKDRETSKAEGAGGTEAKGRGREETRRRRDGKGRQRRGRAPPSETVPRRDGGVLARHNTRLPTPPSTRLLRVRRFQTSLVPPGYKNYK